MAPTPGASVMFALPGDRSVGVSIVYVPATLLGPGRCAGGPASQVVWVSPFHVPR
jgi:hypothetical protein